MMTAESMSSKRPVLRLTEALFSFLIKFVIYKILGKTTATFIIEVKVIALILP